MTDTTLIIRARTYETYYKELRRAERELEQAQTRYDEYANLVKQARFELERAMEGDDS